MRRALPLVAAIAAVAPLLVCSPAAAGAARPAPDVSVRVSRTELSTDLGRKVAFRSTVTNRGSAATERLIAHLNVLSYDGGVYVDPEDWSSRRTRYLAPIPAGGSTTVSWTVRAVNAGSFAIYVAVLPGRPGPALPRTSPAIELAVAKRTTIDSGGILPLALGIPALLGLLLAGTRVRVRR